MSYALAQPFLGGSITGLATCGNLSPEQGKELGAGSPAVSTGLGARHRRASDNPPASSFTLERNEFQLTQKKSQALRAQ